MIMQQTTTTNEAKVIIHRTANEDKAILQQEASNVDSVKRSSSTSPVLVRDAQSLARKVTREDIRK